MAKMYKIDDIVNKVHCADCLEFMKGIPDKSIDLVLTDPPYGTTSNVWDEPIFFVLDIQRVCNKGLLIFSSQPYTTEIITQMKDKFKYCWVWNKGMTGNFVLAKYQPLKIHEEICVFGDAEYTPIMRKGKPRIKGGSRKGNENTGGIISTAHFSDDYYPTSILDFNNSKNRSISLHPTQKPIDLIKYLIETYSKPNDLILDPFLGSGTTAIAAADLGRKFIGIEISEKYCKIARRRLEYRTQNLF